jgi:DNA-binding NtrC family response regulator
MPLPEQASPEDDTRHVRFKEILIVDQDEAWALVLRDAVAGGGFCVALATTIEEAVRKVREKTPDLLLLSCLLDVEASEALLGEFDRLKIPPPTVLIGLRHGDTRWDSWKNRRYVSVVKQPFKSRDILDVALALLGTTWEELTGNP